MPQYKIRDFTGDAEAIVRSNSKDTEIIRKLRPLLMQVIASSRSVPDQAFAPRKDRFANNLIYMPEDRVFSVMGATWLSGQTTPIHDHLTWAVVGVYDGEERESIYRRVDDGSEPKRAKLVLASERINEKGHITTLGEKGIHKIDNVSDKLSKSIHVYGLDLGHAERHAYDPVSGEVSTFVSGYCNVLRDLDEN
ncbi:MAG: hypothetical protein OK457_02990 [Thaumarchaeota archaeon]|nr:hypothetical protein [Nitrososphaerota archaeon]